MSLIPPNLMRYHRHFQIFLPPPLRDFSEALLKAPPAPYIALPWRARTRKGLFPSRIVGPMRRVFCTHCDGRFDQERFAKHARLRVRYSFEEHDISMADLNCEHLQRQESMRYIPVTQSRWRSSRSSSTRRSISASMTWAICASCRSHVLV
jgi:hypothetical protein